jgi:PucR-like helix-turn-helix protein/diguanylate cyclase with GGDEF domain
MNPPTPALASALGRRLRERRREIEQAALSRAYDISEPADQDDPRYVQGLHAAVRASIEFAIAVVEGVKEPPIPVELLSQARLAARTGVSLDTVLRRYFAGYSLFEQVVREEALVDLEAHRPALQQVARDKAPAFERLVSEVTREYRHELAAAPDPTPRKRQLARIKRLLAGEFLEPLDFDYDLDQYHLAVIAEGPGAAAAVRGFSRELDRTLLMAVDEGAVWGWLGTRRRGAPVRLPRCALRPSSGLVLAWGEPAEGLIGWRRTHRQARLALPVARASAAGVARYREVALLAAAMNDELLASSLKELFVLPLERGSDGPALRETLGAFIGAERNVSSAASALGVSRHTVTSRLRTIEERLGHPVGSCGAQIEVALQLRELETSIEIPQS